MKKKGGPDQHQHLPPEVRESLVSLLADILVEEIQKNQAVEHVTVVEGALCNRDSRLGKDPYHGR
jgi:hypothetical protein